MRVLTYPELKISKGIPYSRQHILRLEKQGRFPKRVPLGENAVVWVEAEIDEWLAERANIRVAA